MPKKVVKTISAKGCDCIKQCNAQLETRGVKIRQDMMLNFATGEGSMSNPVVDVVKLNGKGGKVPTLYASYCPFCGKKYP